MKSPSEEVDVHNCASRQVNCDEAQVYVPSHPALRVLPRGVYRINSLPAR